MHYRITNGNASCIGHDIVIWLSLHCTQPKQILDELKLNFNLQNVHVKSSYMSGTLRWHTPAIDLLTCRHYLSQHVDIK
jgi:hypothetical protein